MLISVFVVLSSSAIRVKPTLEIYNIYRLHVSSGNRVCPAWLTPVLLVVTHSITQLDLLSLQIFRFNLCALLNARGCESFYVAPRAHSRLALQSNESRKVAHAPEDSPLLLATAAAAAAL